MYLINGYWKLIFCFVLDILIIKGSGRPGGQEGPQFVIEPLYKLEFLNTTGGILHCSARGDPPPTVTWVVGETGLTPVAEELGLRTIMHNGSLSFQPFGPTSFRQDIHATSYRCLASNSIGAIVSRPVTVRAVVRQDYEVQVYDEYVISGNTAVLRCRIPTFVSEYVSVVGWLQDTSVVIESGASGKWLFFFIDTEQTSYWAFLTGGKYMMLHDGSLHIYRADANDGYRSYRCRTNHTLTGEVRDSSSGRVIITEPHGDVAPRLSVDKRTQVTVRSGYGAVLPCAAQAHPNPVYKWIRVGDGVMSDVVGASSRFSQIGGLLLVTSVGVSDQGRYLCMINNTIGHETVEVTLRVTEPLSVHVSPSRFVVDMGQSASLRCVVHGHPVTSLTWLHNGRPLPPDQRFVFPSRELLRIGKVGKEDRGMYQCIVVSGTYESAQASSQLLLGDSSPELTYRFQQQTLQPGPSVSLKCVAKGNPPPQFKWTLDGFPLPESERFLVGQYVTIHDDVISHVNISNVRVEDGGEYTCSASNNVGEISHSAKVNVYGLPFVRPMRRISAVAGSDLVIKCPVAGYPIESITWEKEGQALPRNVRQRVFENGTLLVIQTQRGTDEGRYTCTAANKHGHSSSRDVTVSVIVPPKINPFSFVNSVLSEGNRASIICQILEGDLPIKFEWRKNGGPVPHHEGVSTRLLDDYSSQLVIERISSRHNGEYTCLVSNKASAVSHTARLTVNVPPHWVSEPQGTAAPQGSTVVLHCQADGFPEPTVTWKRATGRKGEEHYEPITFSSQIYVASNSSLVFKSIEKSMEGNYLCEARNGIRSGLSKVVHLTVNAPAHFPEKMGRIVVRLSETAHLRCPARGDRPIDVLWSIDGRRIDTHTDTRISVREEEIEEGIVSTLAVTGAARRHSGAYTCSAANAFGRDSRTVELVVQEEPEAPRNLRIVEAQSREVTLSWMAPYTGNSPIQNYIIQYKLASQPWSSMPEKLSIPGKQTESTIKDLTPASAYHLKVIAQNAMGMGAPSEVIQATTKEEEPSGPPREVRVIPESSTSLRVTWEPPSRDLWNGNILGYYLGYRLHAHSSDYNLQTVEVGSSYGGSATLTGLQKYTRYEVVVQAFNSRGAGPLSSPTIATTLEDAPSAPPETIRCESTSSTAISVAWRPPPVSGQNGLIKGYRVMYRLASKYPDDAPQTKATSAESTNLFGLEKFSNYSISVLAYTSAGDGVVSQAVFCRTLQDVPDAPRNIKVVTSSLNTLLVTWLPPKKLNGELVKYSLYMAMLNNQGQTKELPPRSLGPTETSYTVEGVSSLDFYEFWVTASTQPGEGAPCRKVKTKPSSTVPARIASFALPLEVAWKEDVRLLCHSVGDPHPHIAWSQNDKAVTTNDRIQILPNGSLLIRDVQKTDAGNLTCTASNIHGSDSIVYFLKVQVPPSPPTLYVQGSTKESLTLRWTLRPHNTPVRGYIINYQRGIGDWEEVQLHTTRTSHTLSGLVCGSRYQLYVTAYNKVGTGLPSEILKAATKGSEPIIPSKSRLLDVNSTSVLVHLSTWGDGGCTILYYSIMYKPSGSRDWHTASHNIAASEKTWVIRDLEPNSKYSVSVKAYNQAGSSTATYEISTTAPPGMFVNDASGANSGIAPTVPVHQDLRVIIPSAAAVVLIFITAGVGIRFFRKRKLDEEASREIAESPSTTQIQNQQNQNRQYSVVPTNSPSTQDTNTYKADSSDYIEDICPYATFQLPSSGKTQYGESTDSGIVYSGAYHPVQAAFVYHDPKMATLETLPLRHVKEPQYSKVRRKGRRDPHQESTESDNLGSTDSEVKKILTLHMPISEYDTLGSDSEGAVPTDSPPTFAESAGLAQAHIHARPPSSSTKSSRPESVVSSLGGRGGADIFKHRVHTRQQEASKSQENSSSSTDTSTSGRRSHHRRGKKTGKRQTRSGSRSGIEETSFSHSSVFGGGTPAPPPRGYSSSREFSELECDIPIRRGSSSVKFPPSDTPTPGISTRGQVIKNPQSSQPPYKHYKGATRAREQSYQINV